MNKFFTYILLRMAFVAILLSCSSAAFAQTTAQQLQKLVAADRADGDLFGYSVSIDGNYAIVGAYLEDHDTTGTSSSSTTANGYADVAGAAYIFERSSAGTWQQVQKLVANDRQPFDLFGSSVSISGNYALVGANSEDHDTTGTSSSSNTANGYAISAGAAYIFERSSTGTWQQVQKLVASDRQPFDLFGSSVSISGNYALVGANSEDHDTSGTSSSTSGNGGATQAGSAYIFERNSGGGWQQVQKLVANDRQFNNEFGISVSLSGNYAIVGARYESHDTTGTSSSSNTANGYAISAGAAYIFERSSAGAWQQVQKLISSDRQSYDEFGRSVSIDGNYAIVGAYQEDHDTTGTSSSTTTANGYAISAGAAYIFEHSSAGTWQQVQKLISSDRQSYDEFGRSVSIDGNYAIVGAYQEDHDTTGTSSSTTTANGYADVAGAAYIFERSSAGAWQQVQKLVANDRQPFDLFGSSVSISGNYAIVGAREEDHDTTGTSSSSTTANGFASNAGSSYIFGITPATTTPTAQTITWTGATSTDWNTASNWSPAQVPTAIDSVNVPNVTNDPHLGGDSFNVGSLNLMTGGKITLGTGGELLVENDAVIVGTIAGSAPSTELWVYGNSIKGSGRVDVAELHFPGSGTVTFEPVGVLKANGGILFLGPNTALTLTRSIVLNSNANGSASIAPLATTASIAGDVRQEVFMGGDQDWRYLGAVKRNATLKDISDDITLYGFTGAPLNTTGSSNTWRYSPDSGYLRPDMGLATPMKVGQGWQVYTFYSEPEYDMRGTPVQGTVNYPVGGTSGDFNLLANSYPAPMDWNAATSGWTSNNIGSTISIWDADNNAYATYNASTNTATGNGSRYIASGQAFFVETTGSSPSLSSTESVKAIDQNPDFLAKEERNIIRLSLSDAQGRMSEALVGLHPQAEVGQDRLDAKALVALNAAPGMEPAVALATSGNVQNYLPLPQVGERYILPLTFTARDGADAITFSGIEGIEAGIKVYAEHRDGSSRIQLTEGAELKIENGQEWVLVLENGTVGITSTATATEVKLYPNPASVGGAITAALPAGITTANAVLVDAAGRVVAQERVTGSQATLTAPAVAGVYTLQLHSATGVAVGRVVVK